MASAVQTQASKPHTHSSSPHNTDVWSGYLLTANVHVYTRAHVNKIWMYEEYLSSIQETSDIMTNTVTLILNNIFMQWIQGQLLLREVGLWTEHLNKIPGEFVKDVDRFQMHPRGDTYSKMLPHTLIYLI